MSETAPQSASPANLADLNPEEAGGYTKEQLGLFEQIKQTTLAAGRVIIKGSRNEEDLQALKHLTDHGIIHDLLSKGEKKRKLVRIRASIEGLLEGHGITAVDYIPVHTLLRSVRRSNP